MGKTLEIGKHLSQIRKYGEQLNQMIEDGSFYRLPFTERYKLIRRIKKLYSKLLGPLSAVKLHHIVAAAGVLALNTACFVPVGLPDLRTGGSDNPDSVGGGGGGSFVPSFVLAGYNPYGLQPIGRQFTHQDLVNDTRYEVRETMRGAAFVDLDGDGDLDIVYSGTRYTEITQYNPYQNVYYQESILQWQENIGDAQNPQFGPKQDFPVDDAAFHGNLVFADMDNDGDMDMWMAAQEYYEYSYYETRLRNAGFAFFENTGDAENPQFETRGAYESVTNGVGIAAGDIDNDGDIDLLSDGSLVLFENRGTPEVSDFDFSDPQYLRYSEYAFQFALVDLDRDGDLDIVFGPYGESDGIYILRNTGDALVPEFVDVYDIYVEGANGYGGALVVDIDGDGDLDLLVPDRWTTTDSSYEEIPYESRTWSNLFGEFIFLENKVID